MTADADISAIPAPQGETHVIKTDYKIGQDNIRRKFGVIRVDVHNPVFTISSITTLLFVIVTIALHEQAGPFFGGLRAAITTNFDWFFLSAGNIFVLLCLFLIVSPFGKVRLGGAAARPDYATPAWFAMLFAAGMGIGLMFFGVSEPISHFNAAVAADAGQAGSWAPLAGAPGDAAEAQRLGMAATIFHWGLHPWAIYAVVALALALFSYNKGLPLTLRSVFYPILGDRVWGWPGHVVDTLAVFATIFGLATSLGFGAEQANAGLEFLFGVPVSDATKVALIAGITAIALASVLAGMDAGVKRLSELNMILAFGLLGLVLIVGPTAALAMGFVGNFGAYLEYLPALSAPFGREDANFSEGWTSFYWAWWISWSPFVGMFIARISRGRTVREFLIAVLIAPTLVSVLWMTVFGGAAVSQIVNDGHVALAAAPLELKLFTMLEALPLTGIASIAGVVLVIVFFVTSSDSGSLVIDTITAGGKTNAPTPQRVFWCVLEGLLAIALLLGGGLGALQAASVSTGLPFTIVLLLACFAILKGLRDELRVMKAG